ncbi:putative Fucose mutarotase [Hypsibius exemplaris]|uniref:Fucose mutarotase n=1 Tax=Hypsibius exemplaris TaxID=2072580 RepID=A0A9X6RM50_HYPEX|nr:putative Fucose mutarotase [Hypsibius exemplaris]
MVCLKGIPRNLSPELLLALAQMGHADEIVLADANFPSSSICRSGPRELRADGQNIPELLRSILQLLPLDQYDPQPVLLMDLEPQDKAQNLQTPIWNVYATVIAEAGETAAAKTIAPIDRFEFYERAKKAFAVVHTGEAALYGNIILKKGVIP